MNMQTPSQLADKASNAAPDPIVLSAQGLVKRYGSLQALDTVSFHVRDGEAVGVVGPNGAGKTTLFGALAGTFPVNEGAITFNGTPITYASASERNLLGIARTYQVPRPFLGMTVFENILVAARAGGNNTFTVIETPGHTWGTASYLYGVTDGDDSYRAITIGGLGLNAIEGPPQVVAFIESLDRVQALVESRDMGVQVQLTTHGFSNNLDEDRQLLATRAEGEPNVMVDPDGLLAQIETLRAGAVARLEVERANQ